MTSKRILVIEDNEQNRYLLRFILEKHGYEVFEADDGHTGLEQAVQCSPELILLDIQLPRMDGLEVAQRLRDNPRLRDTAIVAVTSHAMAGDRERILAAGCDGYMEKPLHTESLVSEIEQYFCS